MKIIKKKNENTYIIQKSKFIGLTYIVYTKEEIANILKDLGKTYSLATHICYAYILPDTKKYFDDKEPTNTAGKPILELLEKNNLCYILAVVVRYFGGIKLGANNLLRAYTKTINDNLKNNIKELEYAYQIRIIEDYEKSKMIDYLLKDSIITKKEYQDKIIIEAIVKEKILETFSNINYEIMQKVIL